MDFQCLAKLLLMFHQVFVLQKINQGLSKVLPNFNLALSFSFANV
jgi:hypothetical protein